MKESDATLKFATDWDSRLSASERQQVSQELAKGAPVWTLSFVPSSELSARGITIATVRARLTELGDIVKVSPKTRIGADGLNTLVNRRAVSEQTSPAYLRSVIGSS